MRNFETTIGIFDTIELAKMITHYDFLSISKPKPEIILKTWTHLLDLIFDLETLAKPSQENNGIESQRTFSSIEEESEEIEEGSQEKSEESGSNLEEKNKGKSRNSREKEVFEENREKIEENRKKAAFEENREKIEENREKAVFEENREKAVFEENREKAVFEENREKAVFEENREKTVFEENTKNSLAKIVINSNDKTRNSSDFDNFEEKNKNTSPSTKAFLQNKLKRREVIQGKLLHEFSINSLDRQSQGSYSEADHEESHFSVDFEENRIKKQESLMMTKSRILEENLRDFVKKNVFSRLMEVLCSKSREKSRENQMKNLVEKKDEFLFFNEEIFEKEQENEYNCEDQEILVLLTKKKRSIFYVILEKLKLFFKKNPESPIFLNAFSESLSKNLAITVKILEILQVSTMNFMVISRVFSSETNEKLLAFCCELLNYKCSVLRYYTIESFKEKIAEILEEILANNQKFLLYIPIFTINSAENLYILKNFMNFGNLNTIFSRKELRILLNKHKNHAELENFGFEQQLFIIANKFSFLLRFVIASPFEKTEEIHGYFHHILKVFLRFESNFLDDLHISELELELSREKCEKIMFFHVLELDFLQNFKDFHEFSLIKNADIEKFLIKYLDKEIETFMLKKIASFKKSEISGKLLEFLKIKSERFSAEMKDLQEKNAVLLKNIDNLEKEDTEIKGENEENKEKIEILKEKLEKNEVLLKENEKNLKEIHEKNMIKKLEIIEFLNKNMNFEKEFLENSFEDSEIFVKISEIFIIFFQKSLSSIGSPLKNDLESLKNQGLSYEDRKGKEEIEK